MTGAAFDPFAFWHYEWCPRGVVGREAHDRQMLVHAVVLHRRACIAREALDHMQQIGGDQ